MTIGKAHFEFQQRLNKNHTAGNPNFFDFEIDAYLDRAQLELLGGFYAHGREKGSGFETSTEAIAALSNVTVKSPGAQSVLVPTEFGGTDSGIYELNLGDLTYDIIFPIKAVILAEKDGCSKRLRWELFQNDDVKNRINQPSWTYGKVHCNFAKSTTGTNLPRFSSMFIDTTNVKDVKQYNVTGVNLTYIKRPAIPWLGTYDLTTDLQPLTPANKIYEAGVDAPVDFELEEFYHKQILNIAADLAVNDLRRMTANPS